MTLVNDPARHGLLEVISRRSDVAVHPTEAADSHVSRSTYCYRANELLVAAGQEESFESVAKDLGLEIAGRDKSSDGGPTRFRLVAMRDDFDTTVVAIEQAGAWGGLSVSPNHVLMRVGGAQTAGAGGTAATVHAGDDDGVVDEIELRAALRKALDDDPAVVALPVGGSTRRDRPLLALADLPGFKFTDKRPLVVAAAGDDGSSRPFQPAAMPALIAVGTATRSGGPDWAPAGNHGEWVDAYVDVTDGSATTAEAAARVADRMVRELDEAEGVEPRRAWRGVVKNSETAPEMGPII